MAAGQALCPPALLQKRQSGALKITDSTGRRQVRGVASADEPSRERLPDGRLACSCATSPSQCRRVVVRLRGCHDGLRLRFGKSRNLVTIQRSTVAFLLRRHSHHPLRLNADHAVSLAQSHFGTRRRPPPFCWRHLRRGHPDDFDRRGMARIDQHQAEARLR